MLKQTFRTFAELVFPLRPDARIVRDLSADTLIPLTSAAVHNAPLSLLPFRDERVRACIHEAKFHDNERACMLLGQVLATYLQTRDTQIIIPTPLSNTRRKERGYNQVARIAEAARKHVPIHIYEEVLYKHIDTEPQTSLPKKDRLKNVHDAFRVYDTKQTRAAVEGNDIILLDDVTTTGATLKAARTSLETLKPRSITCLALAH